MAPGQCGRVDPRRPPQASAFIDREYAKDEAAARSEYGAEWRDDITTFLDREQIEALVDEGVAQRGVSWRYRYIAHCDPSGGRSDSMTLAIGHLEGDRVVLDYLVEKQPPFDPDVVGKGNGAVPPDCKGMRAIGSYRRAVRPCGPLWRRRWRRPCGGENCSHCNGATWTWIGRSR
jgi:hypothetical protein